MSKASFRDRYPPPWRNEAIDGGLKVVANDGRSLAYVYALEGIARSASPDALTHAEALALAKAIASLADR